MIEELYPIGCYVWYCGNTFAPTVYKYLGTDVDLNKYRIQALEKSANGYKLVLVVSRSDFRMATAAEVLLYTKEYDEGKIFRLETGDDSKG